MKQSHTQTTADNTTLCHSLQLVNDRADLNVEQAFVVGHDLGRVSSLTYFIFFVYIEMKPDELPLYKNIAYTLDRYTWALFGGSILATWLAGWMLSQTDDEYRVRNKEMLMYEIEMNV